MSRCGVLHLNFPREHRPKPTSCFQVILLMMAGICFSASTDPAEQTQEVFIKGILRERREMNRAGQSVLVSPSEETRFDTQTHFKADPSITLSGSGASGVFSLPLFRGQDARASHIFVDDMELQDPYSGLPMIDDLDLRAFGSMAIHKGVSPWNVPVLDPGGVVQFSLRKTSSILQGGASHGDVAGSSLWLKSETPRDFALDGGLYGRRGSSKGNYPYYSDNNTVLNPSDDAVVRRGNNDRSSTQGLAHAAWSGFGPRVRALYWLQSSELGIPVNQVGGDGSARLAADTQVATAALRTDLTDANWLGLDAGVFAAKRMFNDPANDIGFATKRTLKSRSARFRSSVGGDGGVFNWIVSLERQEAKSDLSSNYSEDSFAPRTSAYKLFLGAKYEFLDVHTLEIKGGLNWYDASIQSIDKSLDDSVRKNKSFGSSIGWSRFADDWLFYSQIAKSTRAPSLLERLGDGAEIDGAGTLANEESRMIELGSRYIYHMTSDLRSLLNLTVWARDNDDVIRIERVSATRLRAQNAGGQKYRGIETRVDFGSESYGLEMAISWMDARQIASQRLVPYTPMWQAAGGVRCELWERWMFRTLSRFIGRMYQDASNTRELSWTLSHDASLDYTSESSRWKAGLSLQNVTNVQSTTVRDVTTGQDDGRTAWTQFNGEPLPGRSWLVSVSAGL